MGRAPCCEKNGLKKGPWTPEEDQKLMDYIQKNGYGNWRTLPKNAGLQRCGKSCRLRWTNYLRPDIKRGRFSFEEEETIIQLHSILGNKWSAIAARLPGRTDNEIKNYWNTHIRKRLLRMGIDPVTHSPRLDLLDLLNPSLYAHPPSQINFSRLLGINPDLIRLATSLLSSDRRNHHPQIIPQFSPSTLPLQDVSIPTTSTLTTDDQAQQFMQYDAQPDHFGSQWQQTAAVPNYVYYGGADPSSETSTFQSNSSNNNFSFNSVLSNISTPSSSPTPLHYNMPSSTGGSGEDERESYCSNMLKFEIPADILDVADFI